MRQFPVPYGLPNVWVGDMDAEFGWSGATTDTETLGDGTVREIRRTWDLRYVAV